jgi:hypothetical protein
MADNKDSDKQYTVDLTNGPASSGLSIMLQYLKPKSVASTSCVTVSATEAKKSEFGSASSAQEFDDDDGAAEEPPSQRPLAQPVEGQGAILDPKRLLRSALRSIQGLHNYSWLVVRRLRAHFHSVCAGPFLGRPTSSANNTVRSSRPKCARCCVPSRSLRCASMGTPWYRARGPYTPIRWN